MSPEGAALTLVFAALIDCWGLGGPRFAPLFDRLAFIGWVAGWQVGFQGAGLTEMLSGFLDGAFATLAGIWHAPLFVGVMHIGPQLVGIIVAFVTLGAMLPQRVRLLGRLSHIEFDHLRQIGQSAMAKTGATRTAVPTAGATVVTAPSRSTWLRKVFPGSINVGMVALALLYVTTATVVRGGIGAGMGWGVDHCVAVAHWCTLPFLASMGYS